MDDRLAKYTALVDPAAEGELERCLDGADRGLRDPERNLMMAVLIGGITERHSEWVAGIGGLGPFTFWNICEALGINPEVLRRQLLRMFSEREEIKQPRRSVTVGMSAQARVSHARRRRERVARAG